MKFSNALRPAMAAMILSAAFAVATPAQAQGPSGSYGSGIACNNLDASLPATLVLTFYAQDSDTVALSYTDPNQVPAGASRNYFTPSSPPGLASGFIGSAVVSSDRALSCNVNTQVVSAGVGSAATPARAGSSAGLDSSQAAAVLYAPQVMKALAGTYNSYIAVQNTDSAAIQVTVSYKDRNGNAFPAADETVSIKPQATHLFYQASNANLPNGFLGGATVTSTGGKLVGAAAFYNSGATAGTAQFHAYNTFSAGGTKLFAPRIVRNYYGYNSGLSIQNIGTAAGTVKITFTFAGQSFVVNSPNIPAGSTYSPFVPNLTELAGVDALAVSARTGSAVIEGTGSTFVAIANEDNRGQYFSGATGPAIPTEQVGFGSTYNTFVDGSATNTVFFAQVPSKAGGFFSGGFQVANASANAGTCTITYAGVAGATESNVALAANASLSRFAPNVANLIVAPATSFNSAVKVACTVPVYGIANFSARSATYFGDSFVTSNGLNQ
jgi:hypothetical protein